MSDTANPDVPPPRYTEIGGWRHLVMDEQEWLARPAAWGIEQLPEQSRARKQALYYHSYWPRMAEWLTCEVCRPGVQALFGEEGFRYPEFVHHGGEEETRSQYAAQHGGARCDCWPIIRELSQYARGIVTGTELFCRIIDTLQEEVQGRGIQATVRAQARKEWDRTLALELVGPNPYRSVAFDPAWRTSAAVAIARGMYEGRDFGAMPILADALQDAGCENADILDHGRAVGPHVRGCWVIDLVLGLS